MCCNHFALEYVNQNAHACSRNSLCYSLLDGSVANKATLKNGVGCRTKFNGNRALRHLMNHFAPRSSLQQEGMSQPPETCCKTKRSCTYDSYDLFLEISSDPSRKKTWCRYNHCSLWCSQSDSVQVNAKVASPLATGAAASA